MVDAHQVSAQWNPTTAVLRLSGASLLPGTRARGEGGGLDTSPAILSFCCLLQWYGAVALYRGYQHAQDCAVSATLNVRYVEYAVLTTTLVQRKAPDCLILDGTRTVVK